MRAAAFACKARPPLPAGVCSAAKPKRSRLHQGAAGPAAAAWASWASQACTASTTGLAWYPSSARSDSAAAWADGQRAAVRLGSGGIASVNSVHCVPGSSNAQVPSHSWRTCTGQALNQGAPAPAVWSQCVCRGGGQAREQVKVTGRRRLWEMVQKHPAAFQPPTAASPNPPASTPSWCRCW